MSRLLLLHFVLRYAYIPRNREIATDVGEKRGEFDLPRRICYRENNMHFCAIQTLAVAARYCVSFMQGLKRNYRSSILSSPHRLAIQTYLRAYGGCHSNASSSTLTRYQPILDWRKRTLLTFTCRWMCKDVKGSSRMRYHSTYALEE